MGMIYTAPITRVAYSTARTILQLNAPSDAVCVIHEIHVGFVTVVSASEAIELKRVSTAGTGTGVTEVKHELGFAAPGSTVTEDHTAEGSLVDTIFEMSFNTLNGFHYIPIPEARIVISPSGRFAFGFGTAPGSSISLDGYMVWEEIGG